MHEAYQRVHDNPEYWQAASLTPAEEERIAKTVELVPGDVRSVLDVGCGDGRISNRIQDSCGVVSLDLSLAALYAAGGACVCASASRLPFPDKSFDLVCATEVLEHLADEVYTAALSELLRVSRRYVLISVPFKEPMDDRRADAQTVGIYTTFGGTSAASRQEC